jgi:predicted polyphosphate/ATP-dependent NAD kinase
VIVCGGRDYAEQSVIRERLTALRVEYPSAVVIHGGAPGADSLAGHIAGRLGLEVEVHPANWAKHGRAAGPIRNREMLDSGADLVIAFPGGIGTANMITQASLMGVPVERVKGLSEHER